MKRPSASDLAELLGVPAEGIRRGLPHGETSSELDYEELTPQERDRTLLRVLRVLEESDLAMAGPERNARWEEGWGENLAELRAGGFRAELLEPKYFHHDLVRLRGEYVRPSSARFEATLFALVRRVVFDRHLAESTSVVELGCGTGANLLLLHEMFPRLRLAGCDWARSSQEILALIARETGADLQGFHLDMFSPGSSPGPPIDAGTGVLTVHAFEQLGARFQPMLEHLLERKPGICVQIEPLLELYDPECLLDHLAIAYHRKRGYLEGYLQALRDLEKRERIEILETRRFGFGSLFHEGYALVVWRPC